MMIIRNYEMSDLDLNIERQPDAGQTSETKHKPTFSERAAHEVEEIASHTLSFLPEGGRIAIGAVFVGIFAGIATSMLKWLIAWIGMLLMYAVDPKECNWRFLIYPVVGVALAVLFQKAVKQHLARGTDLLKARLAAGDYYFKKSLIWDPLIACWLTIGFGASAGGEGPSAYSGGAIGSCVARWLGISEDGMRILIGCGAGAGISGIFKAPVGGMLFTLEVLKMPMSTVAVICLTVACLCSFATSYVISGFTWDVSFTALVPFNPHHLLWVSLLGLFCGVYSIYYNHTRNYTTSCLGKIGNVWVKCILSGLGMSVMIFFLPAMFGEGYQVMKEMINDIDKSLFTYSPFHADMNNVWWTIGILCSILLVKGIAVSAANNGGGVAGEFAPTLYAGSLVGFLFATVANLAFGTSLPAGTFALMGMAGVMAGAVGAPLMSVFIAAECSASYDFMLGFMLTAGISYLIVTTYVHVTSYRSGAPIHPH